MKSAFHPLTIRRALSQAAVPARPRLLQRKCACGGEAGSGGGECAECRRKKVFGERPQLVQPKLTINQPGDRYEQEADRVAEQIMRKPEEDSRFPSSLFNKRATQISQPVLQKQPAEAEEEEEESLQTKRQGSSGRGGTSVLRRHIHRTSETNSRRQVPPSVNDVLRSPGQPLDTSLRWVMEPRLGHDFGRVRVHTDERAAQSARDVNALAYTVGRHIVFGADQFDGDTDRGRRLIAHELAHVVQQDGRDFFPQRIGSSIDSAEQEANRVSRRGESNAGSSASFAEPGTLRRQNGPGRSRLTAPCPGTRENAVVIARGPAVSGGIGNPMNVGDCPLYIAALDARGEPIEERLRLDPGQSRRWYYPPEGTVEIAFACSSNCEGTSTLEFDTPIA